MKIEAIPNKGPASMGAEVNFGLAWAKKVDIASAFMTKGALDRVEKALIKAQKQGRAFEIRLLTGLYQRFTSAATIGRAYRLQKKYPGQFSIRIARNNRFHWKLYVFIKNSEQRLYVGSANFTEDGLTASGEIGVKITATASEPIAQSLCYEFDRLWLDNKHSFSPSANFIKKYRKLARPPRPVRIPTDDPVGKMLKSAERTKTKQISASGPTRTRPRFAYANRSLSKETIDAVSESQTNWDDNGWDYICMYKYDFDRTRHAKFIVYATHDSSKTDNPPHDDYWLEFRSIEDDAEIQTLDGRYFVAHSAIPYSWRVRYSNVKDELKKAGITWKLLASSRIIKDEQLDVFCRVLHVTKDRLIQHTT